MKRGIRIFCLLTLLALILMPVSAKGREEEPHPADPPGAAAAGVAAVHTGEVVNGGDGAAGLTVDAAVRAARSNSIELDLQRLNLEKSAAAIREAQAATGPKIILQTSGSALSNPPEGYTISKGAFGYLPTVQSAAPVAFPEQDYVLIDDAEHTFFRIVATLTQPLYTWGKLHGGIRLAHLERDIAGDQYRSAVCEIEKRVRLAYFSALFAEKATTILRRAETITEQILEDRKRAFEGGIITRQEVFDAEAKKAAVATRLVRTVQAGSTARFSLSRLTGIAPEDAPLVSGYRPDPLSLEEADLVSIALEASGTRAELLHRVEQAGALLEIEKASRPLLPDLSLNLSVDLSGQKIPVIGANWTDSWDTNLTVTIGTQTTLLDAGRSESKTAQAALSLESARLALEGYELNLELQVRNLVESATIARFEVSQAKAELDLAKEAERNAAVSFDNELITRSELQSAELARLTAELAYERALFVHETALIELESLVCGPVTQTPAL